MNRRTRTARRVHAADEGKYCKLFAGLTVCIEHEAGSTRSGVDKNGKQWQTDMVNDYGYLKGFKGADGDSVDVYLGPDEASKWVYVVHQTKPDSGDYDEDKVMLGFPNVEAAVRAYKKHYDNPEKFFGGYTEYSMPEFKKRLREGTLSAADMVEG